MRKVWSPAGWAVVVLWAALLLTACRAPEAAAPSYLEPYTPALRDWTPAEEAAWSSLPRYNISVTLNVETLTLSGRETVRFTNREANELTQIAFRLYPNLPQQGGRLVIRSVSTNKMPLNFSRTTQDTALIIRCEPPLKPQQTAELDIVFDLQIPSKEGYALLGYSENIISLPAFYPILAVYDSEGWRVSEIAPAYADAGFSESSFYQVAITADPRWVIVPTGTVITQTRRADGMITTQVVAGPIREFAFLASPGYEKETTQAYGVQVHSYFLRQDRGAGMTALDRAASALRVYSDAYGPYPFTEMSVVEAPLEYHGMEFSMLNMLGVDTYRDKRSELSYLVIHETAHQWWYSQVGNDPYRAAWLDEGLAEYSAYVYRLFTQGRQQADKLRDQRWAQAVSAARAGKMDAVLAQKSDAFANAKVYEIMVYAKSALFFDSLRRAVGDEVFFAILHEYLRRHRFQIARPEDFFAAIQDVARRDPTPLINEWILTATP